MAVHLPGSLPALQRQTHSRLAFETLLTSLSTRFINLPIEAIDDGIVEALGKVGSFTGVDRCFVYLLGDEAGALPTISHEWRAAGVPELHNLLDAPHEAPLEWAVHQLRAGRIVHVPEVADLPPEAYRLAAWYRLLRIRSVIHLPMLLRRKLVGMLVFSSSSHKKVWAEDSIALLRIAGEIVINALDRKRTDHALRTAKEQYESVIEGQTEFIVRWRPDGTQTFVNSALVKFFETNYHDLVNRNVFSIVHPDDLADVQGRLATLAPNRPWSTGQHRVRLLDGRIAWHEWTDHAIFDESGEVVEYQSVGRDITEQKLAVEELKYRQHLENLILNLTFRFINISPERLDREIADALRQVGEFFDCQRSYIYLIDEQLTSARLTYQWLATTAPPTQAELASFTLAEHPWMFKTLHEGQAMVVADVQQLPADADDLFQACKSLNVESFVIVPIFIGSRLIGFMGLSSKCRGVQWSDDSIALLRLIGEVFVNARERKRAEEALTTSQERMSLTIDAVTDGFYDWDIPSGRFYVSDNWLAVRHLPVGDNERDMNVWRDAIHPEDRTQADERLAAHLAGETSVFECEYRVQWNDEQWRWILDRGRVIERDEHQAAVRMVGVDRDITDQVEYRERLQETESHLAHLARVATMGEVVAGIAHEVNQPLHAAATFATAVSSALESDDPDATVRAGQMVKKITAQITRAADIIRRLREFTRPRSVQMGRIDLNGLVRESAEMLASEARRKRVRVQFSLDESLPPVLGDRVQLQQVIVNLLHNAFEAVDETLSGSRQPLVSVETKRENSAMLLSVSDNGAGLAPGYDVEKLFDAFVTTKESGMGMGLALCRTIVNSHQGRIWGEPKSPGMTFHVRLPIDPEFHP